MTDLFNRDSFDSLSRMQGESFISIYVATHIQATNETVELDKAAFKLEILNIQSILEEKNLSEEKINQILDPAYNLLRNNQFWRELSHGLAFFLNEEQFIYYRLPIRFESFSIVKNRFMLSPLLAMLTGEGIFYVLSLKGKKVKLYKCTREFIEEEDTTEMVQVEHFFNVTDSALSFQFENTSALVKELSEFEAQGVPIKESSQEKSLYHYYKGVNNWLKEKLYRSEAPLVLISTDPYYSLYKNVNNYRLLMKEGIEKDPDTINIDEIHKKSWAVVSEYLETTKNEKIEKFKKLEGTGRTCIDIATIVAAAASGRIEAIFVARTESIWGKYFEEENIVSRSPNRSPDDECLVNYATAKTIKNSGEAFLLDRSEMPDHKSHASAMAIFRY